MKRLPALLVLLAALAVTGLVLAQEETSKPTEPPKAEVAAQVEKLIKQLGSADFSEREAATKELKGIGKPAVPALMKALKSEDAEVRWRAESVLKTLEEKEELKRYKADQEKEKGRQRDGIRRGQFRSEPSHKPPAEPDLDEELKEALKQLPKEQRKFVEEMLKRLEELDRLFKPRSDRPEPERDGFGNLPLPEVIRKALKEMHKHAEEAQKQFEDLYRRRGEKRDGEGEPGSGAKSSATLTVVKKLVWKDGKLVEDKETVYDSDLPGLSVFEVSDILRHHLSLGPKEGILVDAIDKKSPFAQAGVEQYDIIVAVDGKTVHSREILIRALNGKDKVSLELIKRGKRKTLEVNLRPTEQAPEKQAPEKDK